MTDEIKVRSPVRPPHGLIRVVVAIDGDVATVKQTDGKGRLEKYRLSELKLEKRSGPLTFRF